jgi:hypothetical protein
MTNDQIGEQLIRDLLADPRKFDSDGRAYDLLQAYFSGLPLETLRPLLKNDEALVQRAAVFVASELGSQARDLVDDVIPLVQANDRYLQYHAMEIIAVCCEGELSGNFVHVVRALESQDDVLRALAMLLVSNANTSQLEAARQYFDAAGSNHRTHASGLHALVQAHRLDPAIVASMMQDADPLTRRYGAIAARRLLPEFPYLFTAAESSNDLAVREFYRDVVGVQKNSG